MGDDKRSTLKKIFDAAVTGVKISVGMSLPAAAPLLLNKENFVGIKDGVRDLIRDVPWAIVWVFDAGSEMLGYRNISDQGYADATAQKIEDFLDGVVARNTELGEAEFRMAGGWSMPKPPEPLIKYNGQYNPVYPPSDKDQAGQPITEIRDLTAIFYKNPKGEVEVLTSADKRWAEIVGPYVSTQLMQMLGTMGAGAFKGAVTLARPASMAIKATTTVIGTAEMVGSMGFMGYSMFAEPLYFRPMHMHSMIKMFSNPGSIDEDSTRDAVNNMIAQYSHMEGTLTEQVYIKSLRDGESPWKRLQDISQGSIDGYRRKNPFEDISGRVATEKPEYAERTNIRDIIQSDPEFMKNHYSLVKRAMEGGLDENAPDGLRLSDQEVFALRFGLNVTQDAVGVLDLTKGPIPASAEERGRVRDQTYNAVSESLKIQINRANKVADEYGTDVPDANIHDYIHAMVRHWDNMLGIKTAEEDRQIKVLQNQAMMMAPM